MPSERIITRSAGINFGVPNSEYLLRIDPVTGEALSCYNQDTDTEYIGGGGDSDFSTAEVTIVNNGNMATTLYIPNADELTGTPFSPSCVSDAYIPIGETITIKAVLYKGRVMTQMLPNIEATGNVTIDNSMLIISGDCTITIS